MLTLTHIEFYPALSTESVAFTARVCWNGKGAGVALNHGAGAPNAYIWTDEKLQQEVEQWVATQEVDYEEFSKLDQLISALLD